MLDSNIKTIEDYCYNQNNVLGHGTYAAVYRGYMLGSEVPVAVKVIPIQNMNAETLRNLQQQVVILKLMPPHENIVKVYSVYQTVNNVYVITELCDGRLNNVRSEDYEAVTMGIANGLRHLRNHNIIHRDLKTDNIIMKGNIPKIIDFGFARMLSHSEQRLSEYLGTPLYMAPQVQEGNSYNSKCDVWSFGVLLYEMLFKKHPWFNTERDRLLQAIRTQPLTFPFNSPSQQLMRIIERCLIYDEDSRIGWNQLFQLCDALRTTRRPLHAIDWQQNSNNNVNSYNKVSSMRQGVFSRSRERDPGRKGVASIERKVQKPVVTIQKPQTAVPPQRANNENFYAPRDVRLHYINYYM